MMGSSDKPQDELFYAFSLDDVVPQEPIGQPVLQVAISYLSDRN